ncbi:MAG: carbon storage regulator [Planctomycetaceae bacterium]|nr:carbon storage regulator [Planctomycetaceae bacterium]
MLILSRKLREQILIPGLGIKVTVLSVGTNRVQLGIEAPRSVEITRPEAIRRPTESFSAEISVDEESFAVV